jgi:hypothetical protein
MAPALRYGGLAVAIAAVFLPLAFLRLVDGDEGAYLLGARLVMEGKLPYHDFFYPQMFLTLYVYGLWLKVFGFSWYTARVLAALFTIGLVLVLFVHVTQVTKRRAWGLLAAALFTFSSLGLGWYTVVKTYSIATTLLFAAYAVLFSSPRWRWFLSGLLLGFAIDVRLYFLAAVPVFALDLFLDERAGAARGGKLAPFGLGLLTALLPNLSFLVLDADTFLFNVVGAHAIRSDAGLVGAFPQKLGTVLWMLGIGSWEPITSFQFTQLLLLNVALLVVSVVARARIPLSLALAGALSAASLVPTPTYTQYFCMVLPFLCVNAALAAAELARRAPLLSAPIRKTVLVAGALALFLYVAAAPWEAYRYTVSGENVPGVFASEYAVNWRIPTIRAVERAIDRAVERDHPVAISWWPGYFLGTKTSILPRLENHFGMEFAEKLDRERAQRYNFMSYGELLWNIQEHRVDVIVLGNWVFRAAPLYREFLVRNGYVRVETVADSEIYKWREKIRAAGLQPR